VTVTFDNFGKFQNRICTVKNPVMGFFIDVSTLPDGIDGFTQLLFLLLAYGYVIMYGSQMISDGSELLLLIPSIAGVVGSIVLPVLGAVPDGFMVLFSGLGPDAQRQSAVGVGALAGSTIMLITIPWFLAIFYGRVSLIDGIPQYKAQPKLADKSFIHSLTNSGVVIGKSVHSSVFIMIGTSFTYLVLQVPGFIESNKTENQIARYESHFALLGLLLSISLFFFYLYYQYRESVVESSSSSSNLLASVIDEQIQSSIIQRSVSLVGALGNGKMSL